MNRLMISGRILAINLMNSKHDELTHHRICVCTVCRWSSSHREHATTFEKTQVHRDLYRHLAAKPSPAHAQEATRRQKVRMHVADSAWSLPETLVGDRDFLVPNNPNLHLTFHVLDKGVLFLLLRSPPLKHGCYKANNRNFDACCVSGANLPGRRGSKNGETALPHEKSTSHLKNCAFQNDFKGIVGVMTIHRIDSKWNWWVDTVELIY